MTTHNKPLLARAAGIAIAGAPAIIRARTRDSMMTFDARTIDSTGAFLVGELERLDQTLHMPLASVTWSRDIDLREDVSIADEVSSFTNSMFAAAGGPSPAGKSWVGKDANAIQSLGLDIGKTPNPLTLWGMQIGWTIPELESAQKLGRPVDQQKFEGMQLKHNMDVDEQVYIGDTVIGVTGLVNSTAVENVSNAQTRRPAAGRRRRRTRCSTT
ncbi:major capsid family protein [Burkholderia multivorans]|uniref:major capsid family protein n=1 Tax=Burkholderia multivorans TaxID=87883 RepID=UPI0023EBD8E5|nr:major capsid family protein [Burkholderia multivorans]